MFTQAIKTIKTFGKAINGLFMLLSHAIPPKSFVENKSKSIRNQTKQQQITILILNSETKTERQIFSPKISLKIKSYYLAVFKCKFLDKCGCESCARVPAAFNHRIYKITFPLRIPVTLFRCNTTVNHDRLPDSVHQ